MFTLINREMQTLSTGMQFEVEYIFIYMSPEVQESELF